ncbi:hypothetical protein SLEP1_g10616 [Rubroshorea leprosula]|uniref:Uncharacterized protein n=1 Tax=Rubroshorea leprosula TaxID=152421 RepID=A0AAV5I8N1_9ROSI|nr:hypothetical protein SLEP1_g10616 [Rubroshorea leprosula]
MAVASLAKLSSLSLTVPHPAPGAPRFCKLFLITPPHTVLSQCCFQSLFLNPQNLKLTMSTKLPLNHENLMIRNLSSEPAVLRNLESNPDVARRFFDWVLESDGKRWSSKSYNLMLGILGINGLVEELWGWLMQ